MKKQNMIIGVVIVIFILLLGVFYYLSEIAVADDGIVSPIEPDDEEPDGLTEFEGYWKQQILISYVDGTEEYLGSGVFDGTTLSIIRGGKGIESIDYLLNVKIMPSLDIEGVKFDLDALIIVLDLGGYETLSRIVSSGDMIDETISDDGNWHLLVEKSLNIFEATGEYIGVSFDGFAEYQIDDEEPVIAVLPVEFSFEVDEITVEPEPEPEPDYSGLLEIVNIKTSFYDSDHIYLEMWIKNNGNRANIYWATHYYSGHMAIGSGEIGYKWMRFSGSGTPWGEFTGTMSVGFSNPPGCNSYTYPNCKHTIVDEQLYVVPTQI